MCFRAMSHGPRQEAESTFEQMHNPPLTPLAVHQRLCTIAAGIKQASQVGWALLLCSAFKNTCSAMHDSGLVIPHRGQLQTEPDQRHSGGLLEAHCCLQDFKKKFFFNLCCLKGATRMLPELTPNKQKFIFLQINKSGEVSAILFLNKLCYK